MKSKKKDSNNYNENTFKNSIRLDMKSIIILNVHIRFSTQHTMLSVHTRFLEERILWSLTCVDM